MECPTNDGTCPTPTWCTDAEACKTQNDANWVLQQQMPRTAEPQNPVTPLVEMFISYRVQFDALTQAGFTEDQAMKYLAYYTAAVGSMADDGKEGE